ncbi:MAG: substrate-binding domain-containing protein [Lachnospiraceae bacterium]|jgi:ABC-type sugar transport system substrate-binding protein|nr:substrate-binding domain-containing protein [Lachnospiraceae bacterium]
MRNKKFLAFILAAALAFQALAGCGGSGDKAETKAPTEAAKEETKAAAGETSGQEKKEATGLKVYQISVMSGGAAWGQDEKGFNEACAELGWEGQYLAPSAANTASDMVNLTETAITNGADIIMPCVIDPDTFADVLDRAKERGIVVIGLAAGDPDRCDAMIGTDPVDLGRNAAEALVKAVAEDEEINVCTMQTLLTNTGQNDQRQAFEERLKELRPDANIVSYEECDSSATKAADKLSALYLAHPELNGVVSFDSYAGLGGAAFVEEKSLQDSFHVIGIDDAPEILRAIQNGTMDCTVAQMWHDIGYQSCYLAKTIYEGGDYEYDNGIGTSIIFAEDVDNWVETYGIDMSE